MMPSSIPSIDQIVADLVAGRCNAQQANVWLHANVRLAEERVVREDLLDRYAGRAMQGMLAGTLADGSEFDNETSPGKVAEAAFAMARAMLRERTR